MNKIERIKAEKDGLDVYEELMRAAREGYETLADSDMALLKWYGLYQHNTHDGHFMLRVKVVQGVLTGEQAETIAGIARDFGRGIVDCTTRQCFQIHWIRLEQVPEIFGRLDACGLTTKGACGDITRNVVGCTLAGIGHEQVVDGHGDRRGRARVLPRQQALLEPPAQVQDLDHRLPRGLRARPDQRRRAVRRDRARRHARASTCASAAACRAPRTSPAGSTSSSRPRRRRRSSPASRRSSATPRRTARSAAARG